MELQGALMKDLVARVEVLELNMQGWMDTPLRTEEMEITNELTERQVPTDSGGSGKERGSVPAGMLTTFPVSTPAGPPDDVPRGSNRPPGPNGGAEVQTDRPSTGRDVQTALPGDGAGGASRPRFHRVAIIRNDDG